MIFAIQIPSGVYLAETYFYIRLPNHRSMSDNERKRCFRNNIFPNLMCKELLD